MPKVTINVPERVLDQIKLMGFDLNSWFELQFVRPVLDKIKQERTQEVIARVEAQITETLDELRKETKIALKQKVEESTEQVQTFEPGVVKDMTDFPPGTGDTGLLEVVKEPVAETIVEPEPIVTTPEIIPTEVKTTTDEAIIEV